MLTECLKYQFSMECIQLDDKSMVSPLKQAELPLDQSAIK